MIAPFFLAECYANRENWDSLLQISSLLFLAIAIWILMAHQTELIPPFFLDKIIVSILLTIPFFTVFIIFLPAFMEFFGLK